MTTLTTSIVIGLSSPWLKNNKPWDMSGEYRRYEYWLLAASDDRDQIRCRPQPIIALDKGISLHSNEN